MEFLVKGDGYKADFMLELLRKYDFVEVEKTQKQPLAQADSKTFLTVDVDGTDYQFNRDELNEW